MDLSDLRIFQAVVREGGITRAAGRLHRVQSNVTKRVQQLEADLGVPLFLREGKKLVTAPAGRILLDYADRMLALAEEARSAVRNPIPNGLFRLGSMESTAAVRLPGPLSEFGARYPEVTLELRTGNPADLQAALLAGEIDAALVAEPVAEARFDSIIAFDEEPVIVTLQDHPPIDKPGGTPETVIVFEHGCPHRRRLEAWYEDRKEVPVRTIELASYHAMLGCVLAGMGAALLPLSVLTTFPNNHRLKVHHLSHGDDRLLTLLIWRRGMALPNVTALSQILSDPLGS